MYKGNKCNQSFWEYTVYFCWWNLLQPPRDDHRISGQENGWMNVYFHCQAVFRHELQRSYDLLIWLMRNKLPQKLLINIYCCTTESNLTYCCTVWFSICTAEEKRDMHELWWLPSGLSAPHYQIWGASTCATQMGSQHQQVPSHILGSSGWPPSPQAGSGSYMYGETSWVRPVDILLTS